MPAEPGKSSWRRLASRLLDCGLDPGAEPQLRRSVRVVASLAWVGIVLAPLFAAIYGTIASPVLAWVYGASAAVWAASLLLLRATHSPRLAASIALLPLWGICGASYWLLGGPHSPVFSWLFVLPLAAGVAGGPRDVRFAVAGVVASCAAFALLPHFGVTPRDTLDPAFGEIAPAVGGLLGLVVFSVILFVWLRAQQSLERALERSLRIAREQLVLVRPMREASTAGGTGLVEVAGPMLPRICEAFGAVAARLWTPAESGILEAAAEHVTAGDAAALLGAGEAKRLFAAQPGAIALAANSGRPHTLLVQPICSSSGASALGVLEMHLGRLERGSAETLELLQSVTDHWAGVVERERAQCTIRALAYVDPVSGLANRQAFQEKLPGLVEDLAAKRAQGALLFVDLNGFKRVNESFGSDAGDALLREVAERLRRATRMSDHLWRAPTDVDPLARMGGDEFAIFLVDVIGPRGAEIVADRILEGLSASIPIAGHEVSLGASIGIAMFPSDAGSARELVQCADKAMRRAKRRGASGWERYDGAIDSSRGALELAEELRRALDRGEIALHYQPIVNARDGALVGAEALARWCHPTRGDIPPSVFIPIAEAMGLIDQLGRLALNEACRTAAQWSSKLPPAFRMAVNVSARQLLFPLERHLREALEASQCEPARLEIEMTETALLVANPDLAQRLDDISDLGVGIVLDDFGTGYSSLSFLKQFPIRKVKIDRGFVAGLPYETRDVGISRAIIAMAHTLGLTVVAEGVEEEAQQEFLTSYGCDALQGFLFEKALPAADFEARWLGGDGA